MRKLLAIGTLALVGISFCFYPASAHISFSTISPASRVIVTIYEGNLSFIREQHYLNLKVGLNEVQFSWAGTWIDSSSIKLEALQHPKKVSIKEAVLPLDGKDFIIWKIESSQNLRELVEISYFTSGLFWEAGYDAEVNPEENLISSLKGWVKIENKSGKDYRKAEVILITGPIHLLEGKKREEKRRVLKAIALEKNEGSERRIIHPQVIEKEKISEYHLFRIKGKSDIEDKKKVKLALFTSKDIPLEVLYCFNLNKWGPYAVKFYKFENKERFPLPPGPIRILQRQTDKTLNYLGEDKIKYISSKGKVEINLGSTCKVRVDRKLKGYLRSGLQFSVRKDLVGYREEEKYQLKSQNFLNKIVKLKIREEISGEWDLLGSSILPSKKEAGALEFLLDIPAKREREIAYHIGKKVRLR